MSNFSLRRRKHEKSSYFQLVLVDNAFAANKCITQMKEIHRTSMLDGEVKREFKLELHVPLKMNDKNALFAESFLVRDFLIVQYTH